MKRTGYMFFLGDEPMNCVGCWRVFYDQRRANDYLSADEVRRVNREVAERMPGVSLSLRRVEIEIKVVD